MEDWQITIKKHNNGFVVKYNGGDFEETRVFEQKEKGTEENYSHYVPMLYSIPDYFGDFSSKHREKNLYIFYTGYNECIDKLLDDSE